MISLKTIGVWFLLFASACLPLRKDTGKYQNIKHAVEEVKGDIPGLTHQENHTKLAVLVLRDIKAGAYFPFLDSVVAANDTLVNYTLTEHLLVHANPWVIDTLASFDYYEKMKQGIFIYDQREMVALRKGDTLWIPDDHPLIREAIRHLLADTREILIVDEAVNGKEAIEKVNTRPIDVVLMDLVMPEMDGIRATWHIAHHFPQVKVLGLTLHNEYCYAADMLAAGALGYLSKTVDKATLITAIKAVAGGNTYLHST